MVAALSHSSPPVAENFYQNSFKQLSAVQQRQVGLLVGVAVADAAARPMEGYTAAEIGERLTAYSEDGDSGSKSHPERSPIVFAQHGSLRGYTKLSHTEAARTSNEWVCSPLTYHSFSFLFYAEMLRAMSASRGDFAVQQVLPRWVASAERVCPTSVFQAEHGTLLHTLSTVLAVPAIYPYASDEAMRTYLQPFLRTLTAPIEGDLPSETMAAERAAVGDFTVSALGVVLRCLQTNPDATRNAACMAVPGSAPVFPTEVAACCPPMEGDAAALRRARQDAWSRSYQVGRGRRPTLQDAQIVRESLSICRTHRTFAGAVVQAVRLGGPVSQRAMLVGAVMGATLGVRHIPLPWLSATWDHRVVCTSAIEVAQWAWNPPHR